jgi:hypothetical protein
MNADKDVDFLEHEDMQQAKEIEPYFDFFRIFSLKDKELIIGCMAAMKTLARQTEGVFNREEMDQALYYIHKDMRSKVLHKLLHYGWIENNGIRFVIPESVYSMVVFMHGALTRSDQTFAQEIDVSFAMTDLDEITGSSQKVAKSNFETAIGTLRKIRSDLVRVLDQKSPMEARNMLNRSNKIRESMDRVLRRLKKKNKKLYGFTITNEVQLLRAQIIRLYQELFTFIHQDIRANARAFGQYLTPEQMDQFLHEASTDLLAQLSQRRFATPIRQLFISKDDVFQRGVAYLENKPVSQELTSSPPVVKMVERSISSNESTNEMFSFMNEIIERLNQNQILSVSEAVVKDSYGETLYRTGLLTTLNYELSEDKEKEAIDLILDGSIIPLDKGPVSRISKGTVKIKNRDGKHD